MPYYLREHYGDIASVAGLLITIVGFAVTIWNVTKTRKAVDEGLARIKSQVDLSDITQALQVMRTLDSDCRDRVWVSAVKRADEARTLLARLAANPRLTRPEVLDLKATPDHLKALMTAIQRLRREGGLNDLQTVHLNRLHAIVIKLGEILGRLQNLALEHPDVH